MGGLVPVEDGICPQSQIEATFGTLASNAKDVKLSMAAIMQQPMFDMDNKVPPLPFNEEIFQKTLNNSHLRIGYYDSIDDLPTSTAVRRAIRLAKEKLESLGHELVPFPISSEEYH